MHKGGLQRNPWPDEEVCRAWDVLADEDHSHQMSWEEYFYYKKNRRISLNKSGNDTQPLGKRSGFKQALSTVKHLHQEAGGDQLEPIPHWKYEQWRPASSFFLYLVVLAIVLVVFLRIHRKSRRKRQANACDRSGQPVVHRTLAKTSDEWLSRMLQLDR